MSKPISTLPMHLALSLMNYMTCDSVWQLASGASAPSRQPSPPPKNPPPRSKPKQNPSIALPPESVLEHLERLQQSLLPPGANPHVKPSGAKNNSSSPRRRGSSQTLDDGKESPDGRTAFLDSRLRGNDNRKSDKVTGPDLSAYFHLLEDTFLIDAIRKEASKRAQDMLGGLSAYQDIELEIEETPHEVVWQKGSARLLDYGEDGPPVLIVPSLINRYYILDLYPGHSLVEHLLSQGFRPLVLDWGEPSAAEKNYDCAGYARHVAAHALRFARETYDTPVHLAGYCMGGIFAVALAALDPEAVATLSLLAVPWDFSVQGAATAAMDDATREHYAAHLLAQDTVPAWWVQSLFHLLSPWHFQEKFGRFVQMSKAEKHHFAAVEGWVNDGVPLARKVAGECFVDWPVRNPLPQNTWKIGAETICAEDVACPAFLAIPDEDKIVPPASTAPLAAALPDATIIRPACGHVSMVVGNHAKRDLWQPWTKWLGKR